jgi:hypothetical protein
MLNIADETPTLVLGCPKIARTTANSRVFYSSQVLEQQLLSDEV